MPTPGLWYSSNDIIVLFYLFVIEHHGERAVNIFPHAKVPLEVGAYPGGLWGPWPPQVTKGVPKKKKERKGKEKEEKIGKERRKERKKMNKHDKIRAPFKHKLN